MSLESDYADAIDRATEEAKYAGVEEAEVKGDRRIKKVIRWTNGTVAVFDTLGHQVPELQGNWLAVKDKIKAAADDNTEFDIMDWNTEVRPFLGGLSHDR